MNLTGKTAFITGSSRGIGRAIGVSLLDAGAEVVLHASKRSVDAMKTLNEFQNQDKNAQMMFARVEDRSEVKELGRFIKRDYGSFDILVNNAGILRDRTMQKMSNDEWDEVIDVNLNGVFNVTKSVLPLINDGGRIINISSVVGLKGGFGQTNYAAAKAGVIGFTKSLALELAKGQITANAVCPGITKTEILKDVPKKALKEMIDQIPLKRMAKPDDVADLVAFLASNKAGYITGQVININGGWT